MLELDSGLTSPETTPPEGLTRRVLMWSNDP